MFAGGLEIIGILALLIAAGELLVGMPHRRRLARDRAIAQRRLRGYPPPPDFPCPWPRLEPEVELLREKGAL